MRWLLLSAMFIPYAAHAAGLSVPALEEFFSIYVLNKEHRTSQDRILLTGNDKTGYTAEISYWRSLQSREPAEEICNGYKWLLFGRGEYGKGAGEAFRQFPTLQKVELQFFDMKFDTKLGKKKGEVVPTSQMIPYMKIGVEKRSFLAKAFDAKELKSKMSRDNCAQLGNRYLDNRWFHENFLRGK